MSERMIELRAIIEERIEAMNKVVRAAEKDAKVGLNELYAVENELKAAEADYAEESQNEMFAICKASGAPVLEGAKRHSYPVLGHRAIKEDGFTVGFELVEDKEKQIDLVKLCKFCDLPVLWKYKVEKMGELLALRCARELGMTTQEIKEISKTYRLDKLAKAEEMGATPTSNNQIVKLLQSVIDAILYEDDGNGKNRYKVNSHDVAYLLACYTKRGRKVLYVTVAKASFLHNLVVDVMHRVVCNKRYGLDYQKIKDAPSAEVSEPKKVVADEPVKVPRPKKVKAAKAEDSAPELVVDEEQFADAEGFEAEEE